MPKKITDLAVGGQAVIEGVMMRDANKTATAVRLPNGEIEVETHPVTSIRDRYPVLNLPLIGLIMACVWGFSSTTNPTKANFCKAMLIFMLIVVVLYFVLIAAFVGGAASMQAQ